MWGDKKVFQKVYLLKHFLYIFKRILLAGNDTVQSLFYFFALYSRVLTVRVLFARRVKVVPMAKAAASKAIPAIVPIVFLPIKSATDLPKAPPAAQKKPGNMTERIISILASDARFSFERHIIDVKQLLTVIIIR